MFFSKMSSAVSTIDAGRPALAVGLYVVLNENHLSTPTEGPQEAFYKPRPPACGAARDASADNYGRKLKPTAKKTRKTRQKTKKTLKTLLALDMLAMMPGLIAGSALTTSTNQVPNVVTQVSVAYCGYSSGWWSDLGRFGICMLGIWAPTGSILYMLDRKGRSDLREGRQTVRDGKELRDRELVRIGRQLARSGASLLRFTTVGLIAVVA